MVHIQEISSEPLARAPQSSPSAPYQPATSTPVNQYPSSYPSYQAQPFAFLVQRTTIYRPNHSGAQYNGAYETPNTTNWGTNGLNRTPNGKTSIDTEKIKRMATSAAREAVKGTEQILRQTANALRGFQNKQSTSPYYQTPNSYYQRPPQNVQTGRGSHVRILVDGNVVYDGPSNGRYDMYTRNGEHVKIYY